jgi:ABC-type uncharacterized transport systems, ATPase components
MNKKVIYVKNLVKKFGSFVANDNLSFEVSAGEIFGFLGAMVQEKRQPYGSFQDFQNLHPERLMLPDLMPTGKPNRLRKISGICVRNSHFMKI